MKWENVRKKENETENGKRQEKRTIKINSKIIQFTI